MRIVLRSPRGETDLDVVVHDPASTVADLAAALATEGDATPPALSIDGRPLSGSTALAAAGLHPGCEVGLLTAPASATAPRRGDGAPDLLVVGGLAAGARHPLPLGGSMIGRDPTCDVVLPVRTTSSRHATVFVEGPDAVSLADAGSAAGTWIDGRQLTAGELLAPEATAGLGACLVRIEAAPWCEPAVLGRPDREGRRSLHRPPAALPPPMPAAVVPPGREAPPADAPRFGWAAALVPLVAGLVLARLVDPRLALFTLLGPAVLVGQWLEDKRRHRRRRADAGAARRVGLAAFANDVAGAAAVETRRRRTLHPDPAALGFQVESLGSELWSRRPRHPCFLAVSVGGCPALAWTPPTTSPAEGAAATVLAATTLLPACPGTVELAPGHHVGIAGVRSAALAVARWMVVQLAAHHGPADLRIAVVCGSGWTADWEWTAFLPHVAPPAAGGRRLLAAGAAQAGELADILTAGADASRIVVVVDGDDLVDGHGAPLTRFGPGATTLTIGSGRRSLPGRCTSVLELDGPDGWARLTGGDEVAQVMLATGIELSTAKRWARRLAPLADPEQASGSATPPRTARLLDLLDMDEPSAGDVLRRWAARGGPVAPVGSTGGPRGPHTVHLDLVGDGPHALVAGTTGAGKSELLRSLVAGLAASEPPDRLVMLLVDYKGGAAFAEAAGLPHVLDVVTDLGPDEAARAIRSLDAELRRREAVLAELGLRDLAEHPAHGHDQPPPGWEPLPRIVVVIDELAALTAEVPAFLDDLVQLAARGRSLGLHLVLATQRPGSVVSAAVRTNCAIRCCLRVPEEADAVDVVGSPSPAHLDRRLPGRAYLRRGAGDLVEVQVALAGGHRPASRAPVSVHRPAFGPEPLETQASSGDGPSDLAALVEACRRAAARSGQRRPRPLWLPPLPATLPASELPPSLEGATLGLLDDPGRQRRVPVTWHPAAGPLVAVGAGPGPAAALRAAVRALAARLGPGRLHVYGLDLGAQGLAPLGELPHVGGLVRAGEHERLHRLVERLGAELTARKAAVAGGSTGGHDGAAPWPLIVLLIDGAGGLRGPFDGASGLAALDLLERVVVDGPPLGLTVALAADRLASVPGAWTAAASLRLAFRGGDPLDLLAIGAHGLDRSAWPDGRCLDLASGLVGQVATCDWPEPTTGPAGAAGPAPIGTLPHRVELTEVLAAHPSRVEASGLCLTLGVDGRSLRPASVRLRPGQPFLVCGAAGSGRTTALATLAASAAAAGCLVVDASRNPEALAGLAAAAAGQAPTAVVVVDDAERVADADGVLAELANGRRPGVHLVASAPPDSVRGAFGHWSADLRRAGAGLVLRPRSDLDTDVLGVPLLPRWPLVLTPPGRAVLVVDGDPAPVQVAVP